MNSCDERIEKLLNRAGQTISDLPEPSELSFAYSGKLEEAYSEAMKFSKDEEAKEYGYTELMLSDYIMHLTDIIDRMETALENVCGERDYLKQEFRSHGYRDCKSCAHRFDCEQLSNYCCGYVFGGVPEDWSVDDDD